MMAKGPRIDIAIIGGGAAGCYCAYRLAQHSPQKAIYLYEMLGRLGGRLRSPRLQEYAGPPLEIGGMFISSMHENALGLIDRLGLKKARVNFRRARSLLRGRILDEGAPSYAEDLPYALRPEEKGKSAHELASLALRRILPDLPSPEASEHGDASRAGEAILRYLRKVTIQGAPLHECGFWNLLEQQLSNEAYELLSLTYGSASAFRNINAYDAMATLILETISGQRHYALKEGFQELPLALKRASETKVRFLTERRLKRITTLPDGFRLHFAAPEGEIWVEASAVILALPKRAIELIEFDEALVGAQFHRDLAALAPLPACKVFLAFDAPWWREKNAKVPGADEIDIAAAFTDQPMRQCYYLNPRANEAAVVMACFADDAAAGFWSGLARSAHRPSTSLGFIDADHEDDLRACKPVLEAAHRQLERLHPEIRVPLPIEGLFFDWGKDPFGAAWHAWAPHCRSWEVRARMRKPNSNLPFFVCGEAFAELQGWTEGAFNNAEVMLEQHFGLPRPDWVRGDYKFEI